ncbi:740_t:CDS:1 [Ambispora gerdemannii]|uniref:740_t:CDS:1 n=1 Tax=Ambispora gerdemannii TaxID=144530 RepID=A0A9N8YNQ5_9GLOM|nr:740_t:CDS:1 [Ambispora gerdemannii]
MFNSEYSPFDPSEKCHLQNSCKTLQSTSDQSISLPCGHIYHQHCLQYLEHKYFYCLKYIKNEINYNVKSIISRITDTSMDEDDSEIDLSQENEVQSTDNNNEVEDLSKQSLFNLQIANDFKSTLEIFMK